MPFTGRDPRTNLPYQPRIADLDDFDNPEHLRLAEQPWARGQPRPDFYESTVNQAFAEARQGWATDPEGRRVLNYWCPETEQWGPYDAFQLDHDIHWEDFLEAVGPETRADAALAYNDLNNLRPMMAPANAAGDHNRPDNAGDDGSDVGSDGNIRGLIDDEDDEDGGEMPAEARQGLDDYARAERDPRNRIRFDDIEAGRRRPREADIDPDDDDDDDDEAADLADDARSGPRHKRQRLRAEEEDDADSGDEADDEASDGAAADASEADAAADAAGSASARGAQAARSASVAGDAAEAGEAADALGALEEVGELALFALL